MWSWTLILFKLFDGHVIGFGHESALGDFRGARTAQPVGNVFGANVVNEAARALVVVTPVKQKLASGRLVDERTHQSPHDGKDSGGSDNEHSEKAKS